MAKRRGTGYGVMDSRVLCCVLVVILAIAIAAVFLFQTVNPNISCLFVSKPSGVETGSKTQPARGQPLSPPNANIAPSHSTGSSAATCDEMLLDIVRDSLTGKALRTNQINPGPGAHLVPVPYEDGSRDAGSCWCENCVTMAGTLRVQNVRDLVRKTIQEGVPGGFLEAGTWRGGNSIMARVVQRCMGQGDKRKVFVSDSFSGLPKPSTDSDEDIWRQMHYLEVSREEVQENFKRFSVLDANVEFVKGYFMHSLPPLRQRFLKDGTQLAVLRGDGDMYESYLDTLFNMYDFLPVGGYFICDDCRFIAVSDRAIKDFREMHGITSPMLAVDGSLMGSYWRKEASEPKVNYEWYLKWNATRKVR